MFILNNGRFLVNHYIAFIEYDIYDFTDSIRTAVDAYPYIFTRVSFRI